MNWKDRVRYWWRKRKIKAKYPNCSMNIRSGDQIVWDYTSILVRVFRGYKASYISYRYDKTEGDFHIDIDVQNVEDFKKVMDVWKILVPDAEAIPEYGLGILITI